MPHTPTGRTARKAAMMPETAPDASAPLGDMDVATFMRRHWQRTPLLIRQAIPGFGPLVSAEALCDLAMRDEVESRLVSSRRGRWRLQRGPFESEEIPSTRSRQWTLLVQGVDLHVDPVHALLQRFRFISDARLDDLMISLAGDGGGVGPHVDSYDVFLLQASGRRRWRIAPPTRGPVSLVPDLPLKILAKFEPTQEWVVEPGDMLYLPPGWGHEGTAMGECMTYSVGFRAPSRQEFLSAMLAEFADAPGGDDARYTDRSVPATRHPGRLPPALADRLQTWATQWRPSPVQVRQFIGRWLTEPKATVWFEGPGRRLSETAALARMHREGLRADRRTRMTYRHRDFFINGEAFAGAACASLRQLADMRMITVKGMDSALSNDRVRRLLLQWWANGWLHLGPSIA